MLHIHGNTEETNNSNEDEGEFTENHCGEDMEETVCPLGSGLVMEEKQICFNAYCIRRNHSRIVQLIRLIAIFRFRSQHVQSYFFFSNN